MALKQIVYEMCQRCGEKQVTEDGEYLHYGHNCKKAPPGPPNPPRRVKKSAVMFVRQGDEPSRY